jgi:hypothetical protein
MQKIKIKGSIINNVPMYYYTAKNFRSSYYDNLDLLLKVMRVTHWKDRFDVIYDYSQMWRNLTRKNVVLYLE